MGKLVQQPVPTIHDHGIDFRLALEASPIPFAILTPMADRSGTIFDLRCDYMNPAAAEAIGYAAEDLIGRRTGKIQPGVWMEPDLCECCAAVSRDGNWQRLELKLYAKGKERWFQVVATPLQNAVAVWFFDIDKQKRQERRVRQVDCRNKEFLDILA